MFCLLVKSYFCDIKNDSTFVCYFFQKKTKCANFMWYYFSPSRLLIVLRNPKFDPKFIR